MVGQRKRQQTQAQWCLNRAKQTEREGIQKIWKIGKYKSFYSSQTVANSGKIRAISLRPCRCLLIELEPPNNNSKRREMQPPKYGELKSEKGSQQIVKLRFGTEITNDRNWPGCCSVLFFLCWTGIGIKMIKSLSIYNLWYSWCCYTACKYIMKESNIWHRMVSANRLIYVVGQSFGARSGQI